MVEQERFVSPEAPPEGRKRELLVILAEECAEIQHRVAKMLRFGIKEVQPGQPLSNRERLSREVGDFEEVLRQCIRHDLVCPTTVSDHMERKREKLEKYFQTKEAPHD